MIKVLVADDHPVVREGLKSILATAPDILLGGEARNGQEVLDALASEEWDALVLDLSMPGKDGFSVLKDVRRDYPRLPVLVLSVHPEDQLGVRVIKAGAAGYLAKESAPKELLNAVRRVCSGRKYVSGYLAEKLAETISLDPQTEPHSLLSDREFQVLRSIAAGKSLEDIAADLTISIKTARTYRERVLQKMKMKNDVELARYALSRKLSEE